MSDAYRPITTIDDSQFQGIISIYTTKRTFSLEATLPNVGDAVDAATWGSGFTNHVVIARGSIPHGDNKQTIWISHLPAPANFAAQNAYNWAKTGDGAATRYYVMKRSDYLAGGYAATVPAAGTADPNFPLFKFATESVSKIGSDPNSYFVAVQRLYLLSPKVESFNDDVLETTITRTTEVVPRGSVTASSGAGFTIESTPGSEHHDLKVTTTVAEAEYPRAITTIPADINFRFPPLLKGARFEVAWAIADSASAARSYDESWYPYWDLVDPSIGPYEARVRRFITDDPDALRATYPIQKFVTKRETIGIARAWYHASDKGNSTHAEATQIEVPPAVHDDITIENGESYSLGQSTNFLPATPNFSAMVKLPSMIVGHESRPVGFNLWLNEITEINCTGVYNGRHVPFGTTNQPGAEVPDMGASEPSPAFGLPDAPSGTISADNTTITGTTTAGAEVRATYGTAVIGRGVAEDSGFFSMVLDTVFNDAVSITLTAYARGSASAPATITTNDLKPNRPSGSISADRTVVSGMTEPGATIRILRDATLQVETLTIPTSQPQIETLTVIDSVTGDGDATLEITWPGFNGGVAYPVTVPVIVGDDQATVAGKVRDELLADATVTAFFAVEGTGDAIILRALTDADDEPTAQFTLDNATSTGLTLQTSADTQEGIGTMTITTAGTINVTVTSELATFDPVPVWVEVGDEADDIADKAAAELALSPVGDYYTPGSPTNNLTLTAIDVAENDTTLAIAITPGTAVGLITPGASTGTTPGGTVSTVTASSTGAYTYTFPAALTAGALIYVTAVDGGGTSAVLQIEASASPPSLATAVFADSDTITGTGTAGAKVIAYVGDTDIGDAVIGGGGTFTLNTDYKLIRGETVQVVAVVALNEDVRSASIFLTASDLNLEIPVPTKTFAGYVGATPAGATSIRIRKVSDSSETTATLYSNGTFFFTLPDAPAGTAFDVYARYAAGDSDPVRIFVPFLKLREPVIRAEVGLDTRTADPPPPIRGYVASGAYVYAMKVWILDWVEGIDMTISFPGTDEADIVVTNLPEGGLDYGDGGPVGTMSPLSQDSPKYYRYLPLDESGDTPAPFPLTVVTFDYPDGQQKVVTFDKNGPPKPNSDWVNGRWLIEKFSSTFDYEWWQQWYASFNE